MSNDLILVKLCGERCSLLFFVYTTTLWDWESLMMEGTERLRPNYELDNEASGLESWATKTIQVSICTLECVLQHSACRMSCRQSPWGIACWNTTPESQISSQMERTDQKHGEKWQREGKIENQISHFRTYLVEQHGWEGLVKKELWRNMGLGSNPSREQGLLSLFKNPSQQPPEGPLFH